MLVSLLVAWTVLLMALVIFVIGQPGKGGALTLAYFVGLSLIHVPGVLPFLGSDPILDDLEVTTIGFEVTVIGMVAFVMGAFLACRIDRRKLVARSALVGSSRVPVNLGWRALTFGAFAQFVMLPLCLSVPSLTSIVGALGTVLIIGFWLCIDAASTTGDRRSTLAILALLPLLPLETLVMGGYLGYGIYWILSVIAFFFVISRRRFWFYVSAPVAVFLGLSMFVTYMGQRSGIRELVLEQVSPFDRLERVSTIVTDFQLFDFSSSDDIRAVDDRLNQNWLVGTAVLRHESGWSHFAHGGTIAPWAIIPRAVWPDKPNVGGGGEIVSEFTGIRFMEGTSVGAGQVLEFYVNFGTFGVLTGFFALGFILIRLDRGIMFAMTAGDIRGLLLRAMPGLTLMQPGGNLLEIVVACVAAYVGARLILAVNILGIPIPARAAE